MQNYKDTSGKLYALDDTSFEHLLPQDCVQITDEEALDLRPKKTKAQRKSAELAELAATYQRDMQAMRDSWLAALISDDADTKAQIAQDMEDTRVQYVADKAEVVAKYSNQ